MKLIDEKSLTPIKSQVSKAEAKANEIKITNKEEFDGAAEVLTKIKAVQKMIDEKKSAITKPINEALKQIRGLFAPMETAIDNAEETIKGKMVKYKVAEEKKIEAQQFKILENSRIKTETKAEKLAVLEDKKVESFENQTTYFRKIRDIEITNQKSIPSQYWILDMVKLRADALKGIEIDGVKVIERDVVSSK